MSAPGAFQTKHPTDEPVDGLHFIKAAIFAVAPQSLLHWPLFIAGHARSGPKTRNAPRPRVQARERAIEDHDCLIGTTKPRRMANPASGTMGLIDRISSRQAG